jgi:hypothetical protein
LGDQQDISGRGLPLAHRQGLGHHPRNISVHGGKGVRQFVTLFTAPSTATS